MSCLFWMQTSVDVALNRQFEIKLYSRLDYPSCSLKSCIVLIFTAWSKDFVRTMSSNFCCWTVLPWRLHDEVMVKFTTCFVCLHLNHALGFIWQGKIFLENSSSKIDSHLSLVCQLSTPITQITRFWPKKPKVVFFRQFPNFVSTQNT